jgi:hypothetical protein
VRPLSDALHGFGFRFLVFQTCVSQLMVSDAGFLFFKLARRNFSFLLQATCLLSSRVATYGFGFSLLAFRACASYGLVSAYLLLELARPMVWFQPTCFSSLRVLWFWFQPTCFSSSRVLWFGFGVLAFRACASYGLVSAYLLLELARPMVWFQPTCFSSLRVLWFWFQPTCFSSLRVLCFGFSLLVF